MCSRCITLTKSLKQELSYITIYYEIFYLSFLTVLDHFVLVCPMAHLVYKIMCFKTFMLHSLTLLL